MKMCKESNTHLPQPSNPNIVNGSHNPANAGTSAIEAQAFRPPLLPSHHLMKFAAPVSYEMLWQQKLSAAQSAWTNSHIQEKMRLELEKKEKERVDKAERDRLDKEDRERQQREAVQHHFDTSLRIANQKRIAEGFNPHPFGKMNTPTSTVSHSAALSSKPRTADKEKSSIQREVQLDNRYSREWLTSHHLPRSVSNHPQSMVQSHLQPQMQPHSPAQRQSKSRVENAHQPESFMRKPSPASLVNNVNQTQKVGSRANTEQSFSLYGYQPFPQSYITAAQLKEHNGKIKSNASAFSVPLVAQQRPVVSAPTRTTPVYGGEGRESSPLMDRSVTPGSRNSNTPIGRPPSLSPKNFQPKISHERISPHLYQTPVGAFKPYESQQSSVSAPPAHQSSSPGLTGSRGGSHSHIASQDQPQNLVKSEAKCRQSVNNSVVQRHPFENLMFQQQPPPTEQRHSVSQRTSASPTYNLTSGLIPNVTFPSPTNSSQPNITSPSQSRVSHTFIASSQAIGYSLPTTNASTPSISRGVPFGRPSIVPPNPNQNPNDREQRSTSQAKLFNQSGNALRRVNHELIVQRPAVNHELVGKMHPDAFRPVVTARVVSAPVQSPYGPSPGRAMPLNVQSATVLTSPPAAHTGMVPLDLQSIKRRSPVDSSISKRVKREDASLAVPVDGRHSLSVAHNLRDKAAEIGENSSAMALKQMQSSVWQSSAQSSFAENSSDKSKSDARLDCGNKEANDLRESTALSVNPNSDSIAGKFHPKLKKAWLQRHSDEDKVDNSENSVNSVALSSSSSNSKSITSVDTANAMEENSEKSEDATNGFADSKSSLVTENSKDDEETSSASESEPLETCNKEEKSRKRKRGTAKDVKESKRQKHNAECETDEESISKSKDEKKKRGRERDSKSNQKRGRKPKSGKKETREVKENSKKKCSTNNKIEKPSLALLKKTGQPFLQSGACSELAPKLPRCRECKPAQRNKKMPNIFCRFYAYRKIRFNKSAVMVSAGFSEPNDADPNDLKLWLPPETPCEDLTLDQAVFLISHVGDQFCDLVKQEQNALKQHMGEDTTVTWKRVVQGVREMCDVCETTLFNIHWVCQKCGFVICIDCYKARKENLIKEETNSPQKERDKYQWLLCANRQPHEQDKLMMTQIIAGNALWEVGELLHKVRKEWNIESSCSCVTESLKTTNGISQPLINAVNKCFNENELHNGIKEKKQVPLVNGISSGFKSDSENNTLTGYSSESGSSPLSWLADVALNSSRKIGTSKAVVDNDEKDSLKEIEEKVDGEDDSHYSTLRELLIRPTNKSGKELKAADIKKPAEGSEDVVTADPSEKIEKSDEMTLSYFVRRYVPVRNCDGLPSRICTLEETKKNHPDIPHTWYCNGRLLALCETKMKTNLALFQEQWKRGQAVLVKNVHKHLDLSLWNVEEFSKSLSDSKNDLVNCKTGHVLPKIAMKKFWDGFENINKRLKDEDNDYQLLKLKDWPPGDDFCDLLPDHFSDLMKCLPLPQYTQRNGAFNLAGRLPDCFVRPDLGPKTYIAYGSPNHPDKGTTNLHLDISDAVNVMMYVGTIKGAKGEEYLQRCFKAIDEGGCDELMRKRVREKGVRVGALWHIYDARDADKIRDLLNKVAQERGETLESHHDPIHDQSWYLDDHLRKRLLNEYNVEGYAIAQCLGDAVFIPAGAPHQVRNLQSCIKIANDFVSPENVSQCFNLTQEFRQLSDTHMNHEDKLQIKNIIYHAVKDALASLRKDDNQD